MSTIAVVGTQWGDEGKGKIVDFLAAQADVAHEIVPLFGLDDNRHVKVDLRSIPTFQMEEMV